VDVKDWEEGVLIVFLINELCSEVSSEVVFVHQG